MVRTKADSRTRLGFANYVNVQMQEQIKLADTKAAWTFSVIAVITAALTSKISRVVWTSEYLMSSGILIIIAGILIVVSFKHVIGVMYPRIGKGNNNGIVYFGDVNTQKKSEYVSNALGLTEDEIINQMYNNAYNLAGISARKYRVLKLAMLSTVISLVWAIIVILVI